MIRRVLSNPASKKGYKQYNAIMLVRILVDNPGATFTRNFDAKFVSIVKDMLRNGRDMSVQQILRETLEFLTVKKANDPNLAPLAEMWKKEKLKFEKEMGVSAVRIYILPLPSCKDCNCNYALGTNGKLTGTMGSAT